jgi:hypothetical protein
MENTFLLGSTVLLLVVALVQKIKLRRVEESRRKHTRLPR